MGQYYRPLLIDQYRRKYYASAFDFNSLQKLTEHSWLRNAFVASIEQKIMDYPMRVAWMGDYSDDACKNGNFRNYNSYINEDKFVGLFKSVWGEEPTAHRLENNLTSIPTNEWYKEHYLVNITKHLCLSFKEYMERNKPNEDGWWVHPLPLLTAVGNGYGCGDYHKKTGAEYVGTWAFDRIVMTLAPEMYDISRYGNWSYHFDSGY